LCSQKLRAKVQGILEKKTSEEWAKFFAPLDCCVETSANDPIFRVPLLGAHLGALCCVLRSPATGAGH
jgi:hypothetical protein